MGDILGKANISRYFKFKFAFSKVDKSKEHQMLWCAILMLASKHFFLFYFSGFFSSMLISLSSVILTGDFIDSKILI